MSLKVYNTLTRKKEEFIPLDRNCIKMYVCGITLYDQMHLGHARAAVVFDVIRHYLEYKGYRVKYVTNFTDVDDKMIKRAKALGTSIFDLAEKFIKEYFEQMELLGVRKADYHPRATENIKEIIELIKRLGNKGLAYSKDGDVFFRVRKFLQYGKLSHQSLKDLSVGARVEANEKKEDPLDFALWKKKKEKEPSWNSPWGEGRPGWHIECSAMAMKYLAETIDIHGGGNDLVFPHHENEIAQSEGATQKEFAKYWLHNGLLIMGKQKMAKSIGNVFNLSDALKKYDGETLRYFLLSAHYRNPLSCEEAGLRKAASSLERVYNTLQKIEEIEKSFKRPFPAKTTIAKEASELSLYLEGVEKKFILAMDDDFDTPVALSLIFEGVKRANLLLNKIDSLDDFSYQLLLKTKERIKKLGKVLRLFQKGKREDLQGKEKDLIEILLSIRNELRKEKNWALADKVREKLDNLGIELEDEKTKTAWKIKK
ncbi:MAG: cysteine--tRNA ligase [Candidatus Aerophobetes bacterium]|nr:cysteine--tRNA ligase [Candidatus Aerophobetes bacterium]